MGQRPLQMGKQPILSDEELLEKYYSSKDNQWLGLLLDKYTLLLFGVAMKYLKDEEEARDIVQQVFVKVLIELEKYRVTFFKSWLFTIVRNQCLMKLRQQSGKSFQTLEEFKQAADDSFEGEQVQEEGKKLQVLTASLEELGPDQRECIRLFYLEKLSYQQIASRTGFSRLQVKSYIQNGRRNLKILIEKKIRS